jgi:hypothetical protein
MSHPSKPHQQRRTWPADGRFDFFVQTVGASTWTGSDGQPVTVYVDPSTGDAGAAAAAAVVSQIDALMAFLDELFAVQGQGGNVIVAAVGDATDGTGGAYHYGCGFGAGGGDWYVDVSSDPQETFGLVMAEICESYMGLQAKGWNCGGSGGESLSRYLAEIVSGGPDGSLSAFTSGPAWDGSDWISSDQGTDQDYPSIGCGVLYLWWMTSQGFSPDQIVQAGEPDGTLASNYASLTGRNEGEAFSDFQQAVASIINAHAPANDNPWGAPTPAWSGGSSPTPPPCTPPAPAPATTPAAPPPAGKWDWLLAIAKTLLSELGVLALPLIDAWVSSLPLPPAVVALIEAEIAAVLGVKVKLKALDTTRNRAG